MSSEQNYRNKFAISQSAIKDWKELSPQDWYDKWVLKKGRSKKGKGLDFGSLLDTLCFTPKDFDKRFIISEVSIPGGKLGEVVSAVFEHLEDLNDNIDLLNEEPAPEGKEKVMIPKKVMSLVDNKEIIKKCALEKDYYASKPDQAVNTVLKDGQAYFDCLVKSIGKKVVTQIMYDNAVKKKEVLFSNPISAGFFKPKKNCSVHFQQQIFTDFEVNISGLRGPDEIIDSLPVKGMVDIIHLNHKLEQAREVDLKWTADVYQFNHPFNGPVKKFDYPGQHSFYDYLIPHWLKTFEGGKYAHYQVMEPLNVVIDEKEIPYLYDYDKSDLYIKRYGIENTPIRGWEDTINEIAWHFAKNDWSRPKEHIQFGKIKIKVFAKR